MRHGWQVLASLVVALLLALGTAAAVLNIVDPVAICAQEDDLCGEEREEQLEQEEDRLDDEDDRLEDEEERLEDERDDRAVSRLMGQHERRGTTCEDCWQFWRA